MSASEDTIEGLFRHIIFLEEQTADGLTKDKVRIFRKLIQGLFKNGFFFSDEYKRLMTLVSKERLSRSQAQSSLF